MLRGTRADGARTEAVGEAEAAAAPDNVSYSV
jgi:hypothetical protein